MTLTEIQSKVHKVARDKGWYDEERSMGEIIALCHSELSEALEADREGNPKSDKIPNYSELEEELADTIIRILDTAEHNNLDLEGAIKAKTEYNSNRDYRHGGKEY
jgi:NTP pyrophosphatase (non-canonical NTP hydrolase)